MQKKTKVTLKRHIFKSITWRVIATFITILLTWTITKDINIALNIGMLDTIIKLFFYFAHERIWYKSNFGVKR